MKKSLLLVSSIIMGVAMTGCTTNTDNTSPESQSSSEAVSLASVTGSVFYRERIALPDNAVVTVTLEDISLADKAAEILATDSFVTSGKQVPFEFKLDYDANKIVPNHRYNVRAKIAVDGKLRFTTDTVTPVITDENKTQAVQLRMIGVR
ncbi:YbaY family lipoprotein [Vibrio sp. CK2-1]|uniref:YbaY family lipoprotein n=1 Tax=Vibrio sp. CK2-1 TaxID=2912249 RepID=UPI001F420854|nr:YbaY family lipoprotein [Vibrio sp. CK2-1]MCF7354746.1 YbaY family lipoprotein [Vibrio sp. CK2-1]